MIAAEVGKEVPLAPWMAPAIGRAEVQEKTVFTL